MFLRASLVLVLSSFVAADQITLKNGDRISGTITTADTTNLNLKTDYAGDLSINGMQLNPSPQTRPFMSPPKTAGSSAAR